ncbi:MAG: hypothetical protein HYV39_01215 [Candidatus Levybacteria bacterium]|nr:hypothetical protein [Candidatus Levybacteria bacterium]
MFLSYLSIGNCIIFLLLILPFIFIPTVYNPYELPKYILYIIGVIFISTVTFIEKYRENKSFITFQDIITQLVLVYMIVVFVANLLGVDSATSMRGSTFRHQGFLLLFANVLLVLLLRSFSKEKREDIFLFFRSGIFFSVLFICLFSLWQAVLTFVFHYGGVPLYQGRIVGTFGNPNFLGGYLVMVLPFILWNKKYIYLKIILVLMIVTVIFLTASRAAMIGLGFVFLAYGFSLSFSPGRWNTFAPRGNWWFRRIIMVIAFLILIASVAMLQLRQSSWDNRMIIWQGGLEAFLRRPILGYGQENFELAFTKVRFFNVDNAHNIFLEIAVSSGIVGLSLFLVIFFLAFKRASLPVKTSLFTFIVIAQFNPLSVVHIVLFWFLVSFTDSKILK